MMDASRFATFISRIRAGDEQAAAALVQHYEPLIRRMVRLKLRRQGLSRLFDSMDVCQSVLASFFQRASAGQYDLQRPEQLIRLLVTMTRNQLISKGRRQCSQRRDHRRLASAARLNEVAASQSSPSQKIAGREILERFQQRLSSEEKQLAALRALGLDWQAIASRLGGAAQARRVQLTRAMERAAQGLGLEKSHA
ncbi:MAG: sigma-70 family RNA polymerase sigma factor [Planctomycetes bacterium]|nr:sigma-70 family RNA polymerase sigma factor [Planctomycetota bacterium]